MRRLIALFLILSLALFATSCGITPTVDHQTETTSPPPAADSQSQPAPATEKQEITVYITRTGTKYHQAGCRYLKQSSMPLSLENAKSRGYKPCSVCGPPE